jgi:hypothetical protein
VLVTTEQYATDQSLMSLCMKLKLQSLPNTMTFYCGDQRSLTLSMLPMRSHSEKLLTDIVVESSEISGRHDGVSEEYCPPESDSVATFRRNVLHPSSWSKNITKQRQCSELLGFFFFWTFPSSVILETRKHDVSETGSVSVLRWKREKTPTQLGLLERANLSHWTTSVRFTQLFNTMLLTFLTLKEKEICTSETSLYLYQTAWNHILQDSTLRIFLCSLLSS